MLNLSRFLLASILTLTTSFFAGTNFVFVEEITCQEMIGSVTVYNLRVPAGKTCRLNRTNVKGTVKVEEDATLNATEIQVRGNIQAKNSSVVNIANSSVGGSLQLQQKNQARVIGFKINGDWQSESNRRRLEAERNPMGGSLQAFQNRQGITIVSHRIDGNLQ